MKKYIRTKEGRIIDLERHIDKTNPVGKAMGLLTLIDSKKRCDIEIFKKDIVEEADTIEELCDEFVDIDNHDYYEITHKNGFALALSKTKRFIGHHDIRFEIIGQIMGAVWTDKGLIYVAKMNKKGELELL